MSEETTVASLEELAKTVSAVNPRPRTYREAVYATVKHAEKNLEKMQRLQRIVDASAELGEFGADDVAQATYAPHDGPF